MGSGGGSERGAAALPAPSSSPPASARLILLRIDKQRGRGGDSRRASVAKPWETRRAPPGNGARPPGPDRTGRAAGPSRRAAGGRLARRPGSQRGENGGDAAAPRQGPAPAAPQWSRDGGSPGCQGGAAAAGRVSGDCTALAPSPFPAPLPLEPSGGRGPWGRGSRNWGRGRGGRAGGRGPGRRARPAGDPAGASCPACVPQAEAAAEAVLGRGLLGL